jgi:hypothetical protein
MRSVDEVDENLRWFGHSIPEDLWEDLEAEELIGLRQPTAS